MIFCMTVHLIEIQQKYLQERKKKSNSVTSSRMYTVNVTMFLQVAGKDQASTRYKVLQSTLILFRKNFAILLQNAQTSIDLSWGVSFFFLYTIRRFHFCVKERENNNTGLWWTIYQHQDSSKQHLPTCFSKFKMKVASCFIQTVNKYWINALQYCKVSHKNLRLTVR